jgi:hypothetical protein
MPATPCSYGYRHNHTPLDNNARDIVPYPGPLHLKPNDLLAFVNLISMLSRLQDGVG